MKISLIHPSRSRPDLAFSTYKSWIQQSSFTNEIEHILSLDTTDQDLQAYKMLFRKSTIIVNDNKNMIQAANIAAKESTGDILILLSDDMECFPNWDLEIIKAFAYNMTIYEKSDHTFVVNSEFPNNKKGFVLKTFDGFEKWIVTLPIMDREYYEMKGYIYNPRYFHLFADTDATHVAALERRLIFRNDIIFKHNHPMHDKTIKHDAVYKKSNATFDAGKKIYMERLKNKFGLSVPDVWDIGELGMPHKEWIEKYGNK